MNQSELNLLQALSEFKWPDPKPIFYRLYYRDDGTPICYSMEDMPGNYIELDAATYSRSPGNVRVIDGKLKEFQPKGMVTKLKPNAINGTPCSPVDVAIVVEQTQPHTKWNLENND
jgi:hypothetical protein